MAEERAIIYKVSAEIGDLTRKAAEVQTAIEALKNEQKELTTAGQKNTVEYQNNATALRNLQREYKNTTAAIDQNVRAVQGAEGSYERLLNETKLLETKLKTLPDAFNKNNKEAQALTKQIDLNKTALLGLNATIQDGRLNVGNYGNSISGLKTKYAELQKKLETIDLGSGEFEKVQKEIIKTRDQIGFAEGRFDEFGDRLKKGNAETLDTFADVGQGITAAFAIAPLFGENQAAAELQANALKGIAVAQNSVAIAKGVANIREAAGIVVTKAATAATFVYANAQKLLTTGILTSSGALRILKGALISTGIGAIIVLLGELIANFSEITKAVNDFVNGSSKVREKTAEDYKAMAEQAQNNSDILKRIIQLNIQNIEDERKRRIETAKETARVEIQELKAKAALDASIRKNSAKLIEAIERDLRNKLRDIDKEEDAKDKKQEDELEKKRLDEIKKAQDQADKLFAIRKANQTNLLKLRNQGALLELKLFDLETEALLRAAKKRGEDLEALALVRLQDRQEIEKQVTEETVIKPAEKEIKTQSEVIESGFAKFNEASKRRMEVKKAEEEADAQQAAREKELNEQKAQGASDLAGSLIGALSATEGASKKNAEAIKVLSIAQATISGLLAVQKALASGPPPVNFIQAGVVGIASAANIAKLISTPAFARGGAISGKRITNMDGVPIKPQRNGDSLLSLLTPGEVVLNTQQQNALGGPRTFAKIGVPGFADGGFVNDQIQQSINASIDMQGFKRIMENVRPEVSVVEINKKSNRVRALENVRTV